MTDHPLRHRAWSAELEQIRTDEAWGRLVASNFNFDWLLTPGIADEIAARHNTTRERIMALLQEEIDSMEV